MRSRGDGRGRLRAAVHRLVRQARLPPPRRPGRGRSALRRVPDRPLTPFKDKLLVLKGLDLSVHNQAPGEPHQQGMAFLTGRGLNAGNQVGGDGSLAGWASGISVDQEIASAIGASTPHKSLHFGVQSTAYGGTEVRTVMSYAGSDQPIANPAYCTGPLKELLG